MEGQTEIEREREGRQEKRGRSKTREERRKKKGCAQSVLHTEVRSDAGQGRGGSETEGVRRVREIGRASCRERV